MKKLLALTLALLLLCVSAGAESLTLSELSGVYCYPEDANETNAQYIYRFQYPQVDGEDDVALCINEFYRYLVDDAFGFAIPMAIEGLDEPGGMQAVTSITSQVTCLTPDFMSVKVVTESMSGASASQVISGHTFSLTGEKAGTVTSLPYLLGILEPGETDEWLLDRQTQKADELVRTLVWDVIQEQKADGADFYEALTYEDFAACFYPEEDFYMEEGGNLVFFIQEAVIAPAASGVFTFTFSIEELLDEL